MKALRVLPVLIVAALLLSAPTGPVLAADAKTEATFSASLDNPKEGDTSWAAVGEVLVPLGHSPFLAGPSLQLFDTGPTDGGAIGGALELQFAKAKGLFVGAAIRKLTGDASDLADYQGEARAGVKFGTGGAGVKLYASQTWSRDKAGAVTDPDSTNFNAGVFLRF